jgi:integrase
MTVQQLFNTGKTGSDTAEVLERGEHRTTKLTTQAVDRFRFADLAPAGAKYIIVWDERLPGFGLRIMRSGVRAWIVQYRNGDGRKRRITLGRYGVLTAYEARERAIQLLAEVSKGGDPLAERQARRAAPTVGELLDRYLTEHVATKKNKPRTRVEVTALVERFIRPALGGHKVEAITRDDMARLHAGLARTPRQANFVLAVCSKAFSLAERWGWRSVGAGNPCRLIDRFGEVERERFLNVEELGRLGAALRLAEIEGLPWHLGPGPKSKHLPRPERQRTRVAGVTIAAIELLLFTGLRQGEALGLRWADVDLSTGTISLPETKSGRPQRVVINTRARQLLEALRAQRGGSPWVLYSPATPKRPLAREVLQNAWDRIRRVAGLEDVRLHDLRHTVGTHASLTGANAFMIRDLLRHQDLAMTGRYVNKADEPLRVLSDAVGDRIAAGLGRQFSDPNLLQQK